MRSTLIILVILVSLDIGAQTKTKQRNQIVNPLVDSKKTTTGLQRTELGPYFRKIERGIAAGSVEPFAILLANSVSITITSSESGYFSPNQAASVLTNYFTGRKPISFAFSRWSEKGVTPYATGRFQFIFKGNQESAQVYVSLTQQDSKWVITQFNIY